MILKKEITEIANSIIADNKNANKFFDLLAEIQNGSKASLLACGKVCEYWMELEGPEKFKEWTNERLDDFFTELCNLALLPHNTLCSVSWQMMLKMIKMKADCIIASTHNMYHFPNHLIEKLIENLSTVEWKEKDLMEEHVRHHLMFFFQHDDLRFFTLKYLSSLFSKLPPTMMLAHTLIILLSLNMPHHHGPYNTPLNNFLIDIKNFDFSLDTKYSQLKEHRKLFSSLWISFLNMNLPPDLTIKTLSVLQTQVLPHLSNPLQLSDFIVTSFRTGGKVGMSALESLIELINKHNLEYPDFYTHLYNNIPHVIQPSPLHASFLSSLDLLLSSTHLPCNLVASFLKRLSMVFVMSPWQSYVISLIRNIIIRHPGCRVLVACGDVQDMQEDPYVGKEADPLKSNAINSSLWEIKMVQNHKLPVNSKTACRFNSITPCACQHFLSHDYSYLSSKESKVQVGKVPVNPKPPSSSQLPIIPL